jgi:phosphonate transport system substrate-binding protein
VPAAYADHPGWPQTLRLGLIITESGTLDHWQPVMSYLEKTLGIPVKAYVGTDYTATVIAAKNKDVEAGWLGPESYVLATKEGAQITAVVRGFANGLAGYHSWIITRSDSSIKTMVDAKGHTFAFNDPASTSGYLLPMLHFLKDMNVKPDQYFSKVAFLGSHENTALAVATGKVDVASNNDLNMQSLFKSGRVKESDIRVLWESPIIPSDPIWVQNSLSADLKAAIRDAFLKISDEMPSAAHSVGWDKWVPASDADYNVIRTMNADKERLLGH